MFVNVSLVNATIHESNIFNKSIAEFLSPIDNPRYIVIKRGLLHKYNYKYSFACPSIIGKNKETADLFNKYLSKIIGKYDRVYPVEKRRNLHEFSHHRPLVLCGRML